MVNLLFFKKAILKFSLCCMKVRSLRKLSFIIPICCSTFLLVANNESMTLLCLRTVIVL